MSDDNPDVLLPPPPDPDRLSAIADAIRRPIAMGLDDPTSIYYRREDLLAQAELRIKSIFLRAGVEETPQTPQTVAEQEHDAHFSMREWNPNLDELVETHINGIAEQHTEAQITQMAAALRSEVGAAEYDRMLAAARRAYSGDLPDAVKTSLPVLRLLASQDKYNAAYAATRP